MQLSGMIRTTCPPDQLLALLNTPAALAKIMPGGAEITQTSATEHAFVIRKSFGPVRLNLSGTLVLTPIGDGHDRRLTAHAAHLIAGKADITLNIHLTTDTGRTVLTYAGDLVATGLVGRLLGENGKRAQTSLRAVFLRLKTLAEGDKTLAPAKLQRKAARKA